MFKGRQEEFSFEIIKHFLASQASDSCGKDKSKRIKGLACEDDYK